MGITVNGPSGIDTQYIIDSLVELERQKVTKVQSEKKAYQVKIDAYSKFKSLLSDLRSKANALSKVSSFDLFTAKSSNEKAVTIEGGTGSVDSQYDVRVFNLQPMKNDQRRWKDHKSNRIIVQHGYYSR